MDIIKDYTTTTATTTTETKLQVSFLVNPICFHCHPANPEEELGGNKSENTTAITATNLSVRPEFQSLSSVIYFACAQDCPLSVHKLSCKAGVSSLSSLIYFACALKVLANFEWNFFASKPTETTETHVNPLKSIKTIKSIKVLFLKKGDITYI